MCQVAFPLMLGSLWGLIVSAVGIGVAVLRTTLEDQTLQDELEGYKEYASRVRFRLIPMIERIRSRSSARLPNGTTRRFGRANSERTPTK